MQAQAAANSAFIFCPHPDAQVHGRLGAATDLRKQGISQCIQLFMASRLREDLFPHACSASTRCEYGNLRLPTTTRRKLLVLASLQI